MLDLFQPSLNLLTTSPLPLSLPQAQLLLAGLSALRYEKPAVLSKEQYALVRLAFVTGYSKFAAGTDDYSQLDLTALRQLCLQAFSVYTPESLGAMLATLDMEPASAKPLFCVLTSGDELYYEGESDDGSTMVSGSNGTPVSLQSVLSMTNSNVLYYA